MFSLSDLIDDFSSLSKWLSFCL